MLSICVIIVLIYLFYYWQVKPKYEHSVIQNDPVEGLEEPDPPPQPESKPSMPRVEPSDCNRAILQDVLNPQEYSMDDKLMTTSISQAQKSKKSLDARAHWNNNNWKKYYDYEFGIHAQENRDWWANDDEELSRKHVVI